MPFQKGVSGNPAGKPKGTKHNESDVAIREFLRGKATEYFTGTGDNSFAEDLKKLKPGMRLQLMEKYLKYFLAPMAHLQIDSDINVNQNGVIKIDFGFGDKRIDNDMQDIINLI
ncbi:DUF5681 domain-containing protein [Mucilaginibacter kameinonensis]|uniref:DUF5681 domain-containing protein n=1 Tax=Mucilaginibacter kameinonensis TaxID=452286 RepID=UPI000EF7EF42|nr:DUF5681 domain-containing protein [Mucilaginibacter kameinonensis]